MNTLTASVGTTTSDQIETGFDLVARGGGVADRICGSPDAFDRALLLIARRHGLDDR